jgi:threonyl-tRNA synthetase
MARPVIVHRAVIGSFERFIAILTEQTAGKWPFWLSPKQIIIVTVADKYLDFAKKVANRLVFEGFSAHVDETEDSLSKKVRNALIGNYNYIGTVG